MSQFFHFLLPFSTLLPIWARPILTVAAAGVTGLQTLVIELIGVYLVV